jgi:hypothetical protein
MEEKKTFKLSEVQAHVKKNLAFQLVVALRDTVSLANKAPIMPTYESVINLFNDFSPELYKDIVNELPQRNLSEDAKVFIAEADVLSKQNNITITALEVLQTEIDKYKDLLKDNETINLEDKRVLKGRIGSLEKIRKSLKPRELSENRILIRDSSKASRKEFGAKVMDETDFYVDYQLKNKKYLRIRLLHPDKPEHITGADLIYEVHDEKTGLIRFVFLQYKIWEKGVLYISKVPNLQKQIDKLESCLCKSNFCQAPEYVKNIKDYRFPYCCAFLRPTDKLQDENKKLVSSGVHIPICIIDRLKDHEVNKLEKEKIQFQTLTHEMFEHLFNRGFIGSKWMKEEDVELFYKNSKILQNDESVTFYAREVKEFEEEV